VINPFQDTLVLHLSQAVGNSNTLPLLKNTALTYKLVYLAPDETGHW